MSLAQQGRCLSAPVAHILPRLITRRMWQRSLVIEHRAQIAHVDPTATRFVSEEMLGLVDRLHADALADDGRNRRCHARNLGSARTSDRRCSGYLAPVDISTFLDGRSESHSVVTKTPRSASSQAVGATPPFPKADSCTAANRAFIRSPRRRWRAATAALRGRAPWRS
jgi:hypothetical protein